MIIKTLLQFLVSPCSDHVSIDTLVPALFTLFGREHFRPKVPKYGQEKEVKHGIWGPIAKFVVNKPGISGGIVGIFLFITALNVFNLDFEFDTVKKFPEDLPSRVGYEIVETRYDKGELALHIVNRK